MNHNSISVSTGLDGGERDRFYLNCCHCVIHRILAFSCGYVLIDLHLRRLPDQIPGFRKSIFRACKRSNPCCGKQLHLTRFPSSCLQAEQHYSRIYWQFRTVRVVKYNHYIHDTNSEVRLTFWQILVMILSPSNLLLQQFHNLFFLYEIRGYWTNICNKFTFVSVTAVCVIHKEK